MLTSLRHAGIQRSQRCLQHLLLIFALPLRLLALLVSALSLRALAFMLCTWLLRCHHVSRGLQLPLLLAAAACCTSCLLGFTLERGLELSLLPCQLRWLS